MSLLNGDEAFALAMDYTDKALEGGSSDVDLSGYAKTVDVEDGTIPAGKLGTATTEEELAKMFAFPLQSENLLDVDKFMGNFLNALYEADAAFFENENNYATVECTDFTSWNATDEVSILETDFSRLNPQTDNNALMPDLGKSIRMYDTSYQSAPMNRSLPSFNSINVSSDETIHYPKENSICSRFDNEGFYMSPPSTDRQYYTFSFKFFASYAIVSQAISFYGNNYEAWLSNSFRSINGFELKAIKPIGRTAVEAGMPVQLIFVSNIPVILQDIWGEYIRFDWILSNLIWQTGNMSTKHDNDILFYDFQLQRGYYTDVYSTLMLKVIGCCKPLPYHRPNILSKGFITKPAGKNTVLFYMPYSELPPADVPGSLVFKNQGTITINNLDDESWVRKFNIDFIQNESAETNLTDASTGEQDYDYTMTCYRGKYLIELVLSSTDLRFINMNMEITYENTPLIALLNQYDTI